MADAPQKVNTPDGREWLVSSERRKRSMKESRETFAAPEAGRMRVTLGRVVRAARNAGDSTVSRVVGSA